MTSMAHKTWSSSSILTYVIFIICLAKTPRAEEDAEVISSPNVVNLTKPFSDVEDFSRINSWSYKGLSWSGKINSSSPFSITDPPSDDKDIILCFTKSSPSTLLKDFTLNGPLTQANFTMRYFVRVFDPVFKMKGLLFDSKKPAKEHILFDMDHDDLASENNTWITVTAQHESDIVPDNFTANQFTVRLEFSSSSMIYDDTNNQYQFVAIDELSLTGSEKIISLPQVGVNATQAPTLAPGLNKTTVVVTSPPKVNASTPAPSVNKTISPSVNKTTLSPVNNETISNTSTGNSNSNATEAPIEKGTTVAENNTNIIVPTDASGHTQDGGLKEEVEKVAKAIWDAFYVFLALFCACLIALIILIYKARNSRDDAPPPAIATYNPRTASYRMDSSGSSQYDNAAYRNEAV